jgi:hypothetical protein
VLAELDFLLVAMVVLLLEQTWLSIAVAVVVVDF